MIQFETLIKTVDWDGKSLIEQNDSISLFEATRTHDGPYDSPKVLIKVIEGVRIVMDNLHEVIKSMHEAISPMSALVKAQSDLVTQVEAWSLKESERINNDEIEEVKGIDIVIVEEKYGDLLEKALEEAKVKPDDVNIESLTSFLIQILQLADEQKIVIPNLTPSSIEYDGKSGFKLNGFLGGVSSSYEVKSRTSPDEVYCLSSAAAAIKERDFPSNFSEWRKNEQYSAGMTLLQFANGWKLEQLKEFHANSLQGNSGENNVRFPNLSRDTSKIIAMFLDGAPLEDISREFHSIPLNSKLERLKENYESRIAELKANLLQEAKEEKTKYDERIAELSGKLSGINDVMNHKNDELLANFNVMVKTESDFQFTQISTKLDHDAEIVKKRNEKLAENGVYKAAKLVKDSHISLPSWWPIKEFKFGHEDLSNNLTNISIKIPDMNAPNIRAKVVASWAQYQDNIDKQMSDLTDIFIRLTSLFHLELFFTCTKLSEAGCSAIADLLKVSTKIASFKIYMGGTKITDNGILKIVTQLPQLPLEQLAINIGNTQITDESMISIAESLSRASSLLNSVSLSLAWTSISDVGISPLIEALLTITSLSTLWINTFECGAITDRSAENLADLLLERPTITHNSFYFQKSGMTQRGIDKIQSVKTEKHITFILEF